MAQICNSLTTLINSGILDRASTLLYIILLSGVLFSTSSCVQDEDFNIEENKKEVLLRMAIPGNNTTTRSINGIQENTINEVDVLAFKIDGTNETFDYSVIASPALSSTPGSSTQMFTVTLQAKTYPQRLVLVTNAHEQVSALLNSSTWQGTDKQTLLSQLVLTLPNSDDRWNATSASNYTALPMWGESAAETITSSTTQLSNSINMLRMVARIDVHLDTSITGLTDKFKLKSVHLYNTNTGGQIVPSNSALMQENRNGVPYLYVTQPSIPAALQPYSARYFGPISYQDFSAPGITDVAITGAIYTFEAAAVPDKSQAPCLVIGGVYGDDPLPTYYRVDFIAADGTTQLDILRNYQYTLSITNIAGSGQPTVQDAFNAKAANITAQILRWNQSGMGNITFDGTNTLSVSRDTINLYRDAATDAATYNQLTIYTDYPSGWTVEKIVDASTGTTVDWPALKTASGASGVRVNTAVTCTENTTGANRSAIIWITAGRLRYPITVKQNIETFQGQADFTINCSGTALSGQYVTHVALNSSNTMSVVINATAASIGSTYVIQTNAQNGYGFISIGTITSTTQTVTLMGFGTPVAPQTDTFTISTNSLNMAATCSQNVRVIARTIRIMGLGGYWYNVGNNRPTPGTVDMVMNKILHNPNYFGQSTSSVYSIAGITIYNESNGYDWRPSATDLKNAINSFNPDIIIGGYEVDITSAHVTVFQNYINKGGVLIYICDESDTEMASKQMVDNLFYNGASTVTVSTNESQSGVPTLPWLNTNHPITRGPFLNLAGYYMQQDGDGNASVSVNGTPNIANATVLVNNLNGNGARVFVHNTLGLVWIGDGGAMAGASNEGADTDNWPVKVVNTVPYGTMQIGATGASGNNALTANAHFFANAFAWGMNYVQITRPTGLEAYNLP
ncbi:hypothetical protein [Bacteroides sp. UBA939]|uniref:hypothetical protein n=1 Tax=Bacteroides sp. UBA939 TaxID=1946092 RepID=UPI0025C1295D|nr:hypothetical protein [Bacteroides sp. UBA939]